MTSLLRPMMASPSASDLTPRAEAARRTWRRPRADGRSPRADGRSPRGDGRSPRPDGRGLAQAACVVGLLFAAVSVYWCLGGTWLMHTIGGSLEQQARSGDTGAAWAAAAAKTIAAALPLLALRDVPRTAWNRAVWILAGVQAAVLITYGLVWTTVGLLVQAGVLHASADADRYAMAWHTYLWDPWFLVWGLLVAAALLRGRPSRTRDHG